MKMALRIIGVTALAALFAGSIFFFRKPDDPTFQGKPASQWAQDLLSSDYRVRNDAKAALLELRDGGIPHIDELLKRRNSSWQPWMLAVAQRFSIGYRAGDSTLPRQRAAEMAGLLGPVALPLVPSIIPGLGSDELALESERALVKIGPGSMPLVRKALRASEPQVRARSARLLNEFSPVEPATADALIQALKDSDERVRRQAALTLGVLDFESDAILPALIHASADQVEEVRAAAARGLGARGSGNPEVEPLLLRLLNDRSVIVRLESAKAHWKLRGNTAVVLPALMALLDSTEGWQAAYALAELGDAGAPAVPALITALKTERVPRPFRNPPSASFALGQIGPPAIPALCEALSDRNNLVRMNSVMAFNFMGKKGAAAIPDLARLLRDKDREVRHATALALAAVGAGREMLIDGLRDCLTAEDVNMRLAAAEHLRRVAPEGNWVVNFQ